MPRHSADLRFELVDPRAPRRAREAGRLPSTSPEFVPLRVIRSTAPLPRQELDDAPLLVEAVLPDGTVLRFPAALGPGFIVDVLVGLRGAAC